MTSIYQHNVEPAKAKKYNRKVGIGLYKTWGNYPLLQHKRTMYGTKKKKKRSVINLQRDDSGLHVSLLKLTMTEWLEIFFS